MVGLPRGISPFSPGQAHPRDKLAALLWGGIRDDSARASLRQALFAVRKADGSLLSEDDGRDHAADVLDRLNVFFPAARDPLDDTAQPATGCRDPHDERHRCRLLSSSELCFQVRRYAGERYGFVEGSDKSCVSSRLAVRNHASNVAATGKERQCQ
jgi:hypothetical protein